MRLTSFLSAWRNDEFGLALAFSALLLPVLLLLGVIIIQSGQLYIRQAELQFLARQAANSALVPVAKQIEAQALANRTALCSVEPPLPSVCNSTDWQDFLTAVELNNLLVSTAVYQAVTTELESFIQEFDPHKRLSNQNVSFEFPILTSPDRVSVKVQVSEPQTWWLGNVLKADNYELKAQSLSYLSLAS